MLDWSTDFSTNAEWAQNMGVPTGIPGITTYGGWMIPGFPDQITTAANAPGSLGRGFRHWTGPGVNNNSGSIWISPWGGQRRGEFWAQWKQRYQAGLTFDNYHKLLYSAAPTVIPEFVGGGRAVNIWTVAGSNHNATSTCGWTTIGAKGAWFTIAVHIKTDTTRANGVGEIWLNGTRCLNERAVNYSGGTWDGFAVMENMGTRGGTGTLYVDVDDFQVWH